MAQVAAEEATVNARRIVKMREEHRQLLLRRLGRASWKALHPLERLYFRPIVSVPTIMEIAGPSFANANSLAQPPEATGLLREPTRRNPQSAVSYTRYLDLFQEPKP